MIVVEEVQSFRGCSDTISSTRSPLAHADSSVSETSIINGQSAALGLPAAIH